MPVAVPHLALASSFALALRWPIDHTALLLQEVPSRTADNPSALTVQLDEGGVILSALVWFL